MIAARLRQAETCRFGALAGLDLGGAQLDPRFEDIVLNDRIVAAGLFCRLQTQPGDADQLVSHRPLSLGNDGRIERDSHVGGHPRSLHGQLLLGPCDFLGRDLAAQPQLAMAHELLLDGDVVLLGPPPAAHLLFTDRQRRVRRQSDLQPVPSGRIDRAGSPSDRGVPTDGDQLQLRQGEPRCGVAGAKTREGSTGGKRVIGGSACPSASGRPGQLRTERLSPGDVSCSTQKQPFKRRIRHFLPGRQPRSGAGRKRDHRVIVDNRPLFPVTAPRRRPSLAAAHGREYHRMGFVIPLREHPCLVQTVGCSW